ALDNDGDILVADTGNNKIRKVTPGGLVTTVAGTGASGSADGPAGSATFNAPRGVTTDAQGNVYVADTASHTIRKVTPAGVVSTYAGVAGAFGSADGGKADARFAFPHGVAVETGGVVFVADWGNHNIRKIDTSGVVSTLAGLAGTPGSADGVGTAARFNNPQHLAFDAASGSLFITDSG